MAPCLPAATGSGSTPQAGDMPALSRVCLPCRRSCARRLHSLSLWGHPGLHCVVGTGRGWRQVSKAEAAILLQLWLEHQPLS